MHSLQNVYVHSISLKMSEYKHFKWRKTHGVQQRKDLPKSYVACDDVEIGVESMMVVAKNGSATAPPSLRAWQPQPVSSPCGALVCDSPMTEADGSLSRSKVSY